MMNQSFKLGVAALFTLCVATTAAQSNDVGVIFEKESSYAELLAKAKAEQKMLFIDCYTQWCAPCKKMATEVFPIKPLGDYMNPRFVSAKIDMEAGEGKQLAKQFGVTVYPTYIIVDADGQIVHRLVGYITADRLIPKLQVGITEDGYGAMKRRYEQGDREPAFISKYLQLLEDDAYLPQEADKVAGDVLRDRQYQLLTEPDLFNIFRNYYSNPTKPVFLYVYNHRDEFAQQYGDEVYYLLFQILNDYPSSLPAIEGKTDPVAIKQYVEWMKQIGVAEADAIEMKYRLSDAYRMKQWTELLQLIRNYAGMTVGVDDQSLIICFQRILRAKPELKPEVMSLIEARLVGIDKSVEPTGAPQIEFMPLLQYYKTEYQRWLTNLRST